MSLLLECVNLLLSTCLAFLLALVFASRNKRMGIKAFKEIEAGTKGKQNQTVKDYLLILRTYKKPNRAAKRRDRSKSRHGLV